MQYDRTSLSPNITIHMHNSPKVLRVSRLFKWVQGLSGREKAPRLIRLQPTNTTQLLMFGVTGQISQNRGGRKRMTPLTTALVEPQATPGKL